MTKSGELTGPEMAVISENTFPMMEKLRPELDEYARERMFRRIFIEECRQVEPMNVLSENANAIQG
jgi:hypothetical protein